MNNVKCIIGATIGAPLILSVVMALMVGSLWLIKTYKIADVVATIISGLGLLFFLMLIWFALYEYCKEKHNERKNNES